MENKKPANNNNNNSQMFQNNPAFANLSPEKLNFLMNFANTKKPAQMQEMMPFLLSSMNQAKNQNIQFTPNESNFLIDMLKQNLSPAEAQKIDMVLNLMKNNNNNGKRSGK